ncbi:helix-turn-helix transcriptional regulator [Acinetobacter baumannii]|uniref:helix-turn-helix transcriptional regulator n=1 Tax=Acinetobacter baumannii TaxID=470 RepID=UPI001A91CF9D|nr:AlpA family transcriptional regulator [Acinetobacter baumannii]MBO0650571.1 AlpA family transcriptional regulator [Acinetobacter baumannii]MCT9478783.1 AlpA family transcriptional regulator [Acinetobacter baumannii]MCZ3044597.1 AlpA family transcriptional regulator [Acinetobacter baumannii]HEN9559530.1 AlpA family transcriptional regulator [Acinetobacter baumannii]
MNLSNENQSKNLRLIRRKEVQNKTGFGPSSIYAMMAKGQFPKPIKLSERRVAWIESEIDQWIYERIAQHQAAMEA